jgi:hypothetical protein
MCEYISVRRLEETEKEWVDAIRRLAKQFFPCKQTYIFYNTILPFSPLTALAGFCQTQEVVMGDDVFLRLDYMESFYGKNEWPRRFYELMTRTSTYVCVSNHHNQAAFWSRIDAMADTRRVWPYMHGDLLGYDKVPNRIKGLTEKRLLARLPELREVTYASGVLCLKRGEATISLSFEPVDVHGWRRVNVSMNPLATLELHLVLLDWPRVFATHAIRLEGWAFGVYK